MTVEAAVELVAEARVELERAARLLGRLMDDRRLLFDALLRSTKALQLAERHVGRSSGYVLDLVTYRVPLDTVARSVRVLEEVANRG